MLRTLLLHLMQSAVSDSWLEAALYLSLESVDNANA